jgi:hypothetical protein
MGELAEQRINNAIPQIENLMRGKLRELPAMRHLLITKSRWLRVHK